MFASGDTAIYINKDLAAELSHHPLPSPSILPTTPKQDHPSVLQLVNSMAISSKAAAALVTGMLLISTTCCFVQLPTPTHCPLTGRSRALLQVPATATATNKDDDIADSAPTTPGHSPSGGHGSAPPSRWINDEAYVRTIACMHVASFLLNRWICHPPVCTHVVFEIVPYVCYAMLCFALWF